MGASWAALVICAGVCRGVEAAAWCLTRLVRDLAFMEERTRVTREIAGGTKGEVMHGGVNFGGAGIRRERAKTARAADSYLAPFLLFVIFFLFSAHRQTLGRT